jgi:hypothetical protein
MISAPRIARLRPAAIGEQERRLVKELRKLAPAAGVRA